MLIDEIKKIAIQAGENMLMKNELEVYQKGTVENYVSNVDIMNEKFLRKELTSLIEGSKFVGEESGADDVESEYVWIVDPIDGTANFVRGLSFSAVSIALLKNGKGYIGVVYNPYTDEIFYAEDGKGAYVDCERIHVSERDTRHSILCTAMSTYDKSLADGCFVVAQNMYRQCEDIRRMGSAAVEMSLLAAGRVDIHFEIRLFPWDYAAGAIIVREAGGIVGSIYTDELQFDVPMPIITANTRENYELLKREAAAAFEGEDRLYKGK